MAMDCIVSHRLKQTQQGLSRKRSGLGMCCPLSTRLVALLLALTLVVVPSSGRRIKYPNDRSLQSLSASSISINGRVMDLQADCYAPLRASDFREPFGKIDSEEYVFFANLTSEDGLLSDLPPVKTLAPLNLAFNHLACLCELLPHNSSDCCFGNNAGINITGSNGEDDAADDQIAYLYTVCDLTYDAVQDWREKTPEPTTYPSTSPSVLPSFLPSTHPSSSPTLVPSAPPSSFPSITPSFEPSFAPSLIPTVSLSPSYTPSSSPIIPPTLFNGVVNGSFQFTIGNANFNAAQIDAGDGGIKAEVQDESLNLAQNVLEDQFPPSSRRILRDRMHSRTLTVSINSTSSVSCTFLDAPCPPAAGIQATTLCQNCECVVPLLLEEETASDVQTQFQGAMETAVANGQLSLSSVTYIGPAQTDLLPPPPPTEPPVTPAGDGIQTTDPTGIANDDGGSGSSVGIVGGAVGALGALVLIAGGYFLRKRRWNIKSDLDSDSEIFASDGNDGKDARRSPSSRSNRGAVLGASNPNYGSNRRAGGFATLDDSSAGSSLESIDRAFKRASRAPAAAASSATSKSPYDLPDDSISSSSNAGSSGWSSSAGISSINTGSLEDSLEFRAPHQLRVSTLAAMGKASAITHKMANKETNSQRHSSGMRDIDISTLGSDTGSGVLLGGDLDGSTGPIDLNSMDSVPRLPTVSRADLDFAIEAGDWAAVGATAALLASTTEGDLHSFQSTSTRSNRSKSTLSSIDVARAAELDQLVDAGDWEGVVQAAARFETQSDGGSRQDGDTTNTASSEGTGGLGSKSGATTTSRSVGTGSAYSPSVESDTPSKILQRTKIRSEVEELVRRVVPDEMGNIDEMLLQFRGREEELLETLRTMQERSIAQRAREAVNKTAKREARSMARARTQRQVGNAATLATPPQTKVVPEQGLGAFSSAASRKRQQPTLALNESSPESSEPPNTRGTTPEPGFVNDERPTTDSSPQRKSTSSNSRSALELALQAGDWEAVGEAAVMMSDVSVTTDSTNQSFYDAEYDHAPTSVQKTGVNSDRVAELDRMIDKGDWSGVVAAASRYSAADARSGIKPSKATGGSRGSESSGSSRRRAKARASDSIEDGTFGSGGSSWMNRMFGSKRNNEAAKRSALQEEQDALDNAAMWMAIAAQSKKDEPTEVTKGASEAADWAISRSLSALKSAEDSGVLPGVRRQRKGSPPLSTSESVTSSRGDKSV